MSLFFRSLHEDNRTFFIMIQHLMNDTGELFLDLCRQSLDLTNDRTSIVLLSIEQSQTPSFLYYTIVVLSNSLLDLESTVSSGSAVELKSDLSGTRLLGGLELDVLCPLLVKQNKMPRHTPLNTMSISFTYIHIYILM